MAQRTTAGSRRSASRGEARDRLAAAAVEAFGRKGFHATTTRDIASAAGLSPAALYVHHASKEEILYQVCREGHEGMLRLVEAAVATAGTPGERLARLTRDWVITHAERSDVSRIVEHELDALTPEHREAIVELRRRMEGLVRELVEQGRAAGEFDVEDVPMTTRAILSLGIDVTRWFRTGGSWSADRLGDYYASLALRLVDAR